jgi:hypothetical protein
MTKEEKRQIRLRISSLIEQNRKANSHFFENEDEIARLGKLLAPTQDVGESINHKRGEWGEMEIYYLMNHVPLIGVERTAKNLNRTVEATKGKFYREMEKKQKNFSPGTGREVV